jgi:hypothetical protein
LVFSVVELFWVRGPDADIRDGLPAGTTLRGYELTSIPRISAQQVTEIDDEAILRRQHRLNEGGFSQDLNNSQPIGHAEIPVRCSPMP